MAKSVAIKTALDDVVYRLAHHSPELKNLNEELLKGLGKAVLVDEWKKLLQSKVDAQRVDFRKEKKSFLAKFQSPSTRSAYGYSLKKLEKYCSLKRINIIELTPSQADDFIISQRKEAPATVRLTTSACSSFFSTWLERRHGFIKSPFRGTRERPANKNVRPLSVPTRQEIETVIGLTTNKVLRSAFIILLEMGFRCGALSGLTVRTGRYQTVSKTKEISGNITDNCLVALRRANLNFNCPFANYTPQRMKEALQYQINRAYKLGKIQTRFSPHKIRSRFAIDFYEANKDIYRLKLALHHSSISVTEIYLKSLGI